MLEVLHPHHTHQHRVWVLPDTTLGRWSAFVFTVSAIVAVVAPVVAWVTHQILEPGTGMPWFFALWGSSLVAIVVATGAALVSAIALVRDHAVALLVPVALGFLIISALITTYGVIS